MMALRNMRNTIARHMPLLYDLHAIARTLRRRSRHRHHCPCCGRQTYFRLFGVPPRLDALCSNCQSLERHRQLALLLERNPDLHLGKTVLHVAPEPVIRTLLRATASDYVEGDLSAAHRSATRIDVENIRFPPASFDLVVCNHVLEHVDDRRAIAEIHRVLEPGGTALFMFPIVEGWSQTYEDEAIVAPRDRQRHFGQEDHVRIYGADVRERLTSVGFALEEFTATEPDVGRYGLLRGEKIFVCRKPA